MARFLLTILIIVGVYYAVKYLFRYLFPVVMNRFMNKMMGNMQNPYNQEPINRKKEGEVSITHQPEQKKKDPNTDEGEYVDFEEVK